MDLTIGIPVHNGMPYLPQAVESLLNQSDPDFAVVIINDGSSDDTARYLDSIEDFRVKVIHQENRGLTATLNRMLAITETTWLVRQDADDVSMPHRVKILREMALQYPHAGMFHSAVRYHPQGSLGKFRYTKGSPEELRSFVKEGYTLSICHPSVMLNVKKAIDLGGYRFDHHIEDADLWWRMALQYDIVFVPHELLGFRQNESSVSSRNLKLQAINLYWVQYLLLSHLWDLTPRTYAEVSPVLSEMVVDRKLRAKEQLRGVNIALAAGRRWAALRALSHATMLDPGLVIERIRSEFVTLAPVKLGTDPGEFRKRQDRLWGEIVTRSPHSDDASSGLGKS